MKADARAGEPHVPLPPPERAGYQAGDATAFGRRVGGEEGEDGGDGRSYDEWSYGGPVDRVPGTSPLHSFSRQANVPRQVWDELSQSFIITDKTYGKSLRPHQLPEGVARFFLGTHLPSPLPHRLPILSALATRLRALETLVESLEVRIRGGSLLIVVEGDPAALISALERESVQREKEGVERDEEEEGSEASMETSDEEGVALPQTCVPWELRLIDFAHATRAEGQGADQGLLRGIRTVRELVEGLLKEVRKREEGV